jgi:hypothetical protein
MYFGQNFHCEFHEFTPILIRLIRVIRGKKTHIINHLICGISGKKNLYSI